MSENDTKYLERANPDQVRTLMSWLRDFFNQFQLAWNLLWDGRVPFVTKIIPILTLVYLISPVDILPDVALGLGQLDDLAIFLIGLRLFIDVCPPELVAEYEGGPHIEVSTPSPSVEQSASGRPVIDVEAEVVADAQEQKQISVQDVW
ncbi:MAG TPA: DUF1232 domain-containing protein [Anaerolineae bacterium]|nr:DUF1232 domain-containing protein [Anaerolineae bacterium]HQK15365.1 DUF1232 domain-containing protein [Anaerolineae bacterium]